MFSAIGGKKKLTVHVSVSAVGQNELVNIVTSDIGKNPKLHITDAKLFVLQQLNYWMYEYFSEILFQVPLQAVKNNIQVQGNAEYISDFLLPLNYSTWKKKKYKIFKNS